MCKTFVELTSDESAKLHALGGASWVRAQLRDTPMPLNRVRKLYELTCAERRQLLADLPALGRAVIAQKYRLQPTAVDNLRFRLRAKGVTL